MSAPAPTTTPTTMHTDKANTLRKRAKKKKKAAMKPKLKLLATNNNMTVRNPDGSLYSRPPLNQLIKGWDIIGDTQFLMNFAVLGHAKCATSTLMKWLRQHPQVQMTGNELQHLLTGKPAKMVTTLYNKLPAGPYKYGYKNPTDVEQIHVLGYFQQFWPTAGLIVGLRHPVNWFESFYNFRVQNWNDIPHPNQLIGRCTSGTKLTCTHRSRFHWHLYAMHKTNINNSDDPLSRIIRNKQKRLATPLPNRVFLYDTQQLKDINDTRIAQFRTDVQDFIGLTQEMPPIIPHYIPGAIPLKVAAAQQAKDRNKIDICQDEYHMVRRDLMKHARHASEWIRNYFLDAPGVIVSSPNYFREVLLEWMHDPCLKKNNTNTSSSHADGA